MPSAGGKPDRPGLAGPTRVSVRVTGSGSSRPGIDAPSVILSKAMSLAEPLKITESSVPAKVTPTRNQGQ